MVYVYLCILVSLIQMTLSVSNNIPGLDVDNPQKVCDSALNYRGLVIPLGDTQEHFSIEVMAGQYMPGEPFKGKCAVFSAQLDLWCSSYYLRCDKYYMLSEKGLNQSEKVT